MWAHTRRGLAAAAAATAVAGIAISVRQAQTQPADQPFDRLQRWRNRWEGAANGTQTLGWHIPEPHHNLVKFLDQLLPGDREPTQTNVLFPLSGKSVDLAFLASVGYRVVGVEAVPLANTALLAGFGDEAPPRPLKSADFVVRSALSPEYDNITVVEGDFCAYDAAANEQAVGRAHDAAFDRGALVAVRPEDREAYARALTSVLAPGARVLLVAVEHDPFSGGSLGPPFEVTAADVRSLYGAAFEIRELSRENRLSVEPQLRARGCTRFEEVVYLLVKN